MVSCVKAIGMKGRTGRPSVFRNPLSGPACLLRSGLPSDAAVSVPRSWAVQLVEPTLRTTRRLGPDSTMHEFTASPCEVDNRRKSRNAKRSRGGLLDLASAACRIGRLVGKDSNLLDCLKQGILDSVPLAP